MKAMLRARTVRINKTSTMKRNNEDVSVVYFTVADRETVKTADNQYVTKGFYFCKAYGKKADLIIRDFGQKDENGKLISRAIFMEVEPQTYKSEREIDVTMDVSAKALFEAFGVSSPENEGKTVTLQKKEKVEVIETVYLVKSFDYDDYKPKSVVPEEAEKEQQITLTIKGAEAPAEEEEDEIRYDL